MSIDIYNSIKDTTKDICVEFCVWLSRYYTQTESWRWWKNQNNLEVYNVEYLYDFFEANVYSKKYVICNYPS